jgi:hypothetical protein
MTTGTHDHAEVRTMTGGAKPINWMDGAVFSDTENCRSMSISLAA